MVATEDRHNQLPTERLDALRESGLEFSVARSTDEVVEAWQLVYGEYARARLIHPNCHRIHTNPLAIDAGTAVVIGKIGTVIASTMTACLDRPAGLPLDASCPQAMRDLRRNGHRLIEMGLFADRREKIARSFPALLNLMRYAFFYGMHAGATDIVIGVHPHHAPFYQRLLGFVEFAETTSCPHVNDNPMVPLRLDIHGQLAQKRLPKGLAFFKANPLDDQAYADRLKISRESFRGTAVGRYLDDHDKQIAAEALRSSHSVPE